MHTSSYTKLIAGVLAGALLLPFAALADETITFSTIGTVDDAYFIGRTGDQSKQAQPFTPTGNAATVALHAYLITYTTNTANDDVVLTIQTDSAGVPSGTSLGTASVNITTLPTAANLVVGCVAGPTVINFATISGLTLNSGTQYWVVLNRSGADQAIPNVSAWCSDDGTTPSGYGYNGSWASNSSKFAGSVDLTSPVAVATPTPIAGLVKAYWVF